MHSKFDLKCFNNEIFSQHFHTEKIICKITVQCAGKNNAYSRCCIFTVFFCKFQAHVQEKLQENEKIQYTRMKFTVKHCKNTAEGVSIIFTNTLCCNFACNFFQCSHLFYDVWVQTTQRLLICSSFKHCFSTKRDKLSFSYSLKILDFLSLFYVKYLLNNLR